MQKWIWVLALLGACGGDDGGALDAGGQEDAGAPGGPYSWCNSAAECPGDELRCTPVAYEAGADGAMCSSECSADRDCPEGGACYELVGDPMVGRRVCYARCASDADCSPRFVCADTLDEDGVPTGDKICLPCPTSGCP